VEAAGDGKESDGSWPWSLPDKEDEGGHATDVGNVGPLARMPTASPIIPHTYGKGAKAAKMAKGITSEGAFTASATAWGATCVIQSTRTGSSRAEGVTRGRGLSVIMSAAKRTYATQEACAS